MSERSKPKSQIKEQSGFYDIPERYEIIGGIRYDFLSSPKFVHQKILANFFVGFHTPCHLDGEIILAPMDVHFDEENIVQPDIIYIANENRGIIRDGFVFGSPDLVVEILSGSTGRKDKTVKKAMFERFGVKEYWLADPLYRTVDQFVLDDGTYRLAATLTEDDRIASPNVPCLTIDLKSVFPPEETME
ncbi:Uma2 family endonuclease [Paenibacillus mesophilus]|uniref:Uma2 family endonuclease n=1 Tax=Paenibacillus mesophilus TaxID=2582849 RepID=UPI00110E38AD|nr:Uma2 family endonuclease [Paenibacillus mesophilus]TMV49062.1 Uma2 family endonuclease [Paenibacillus mesophilus]